MRLLVVVSLLVVGCVPAADAWASQEEWYCQLEVYWGSIGGSPQDRNAVIGVAPGRTDLFEEGLDAKKPAEPFGDYVYTWFYHPSWNAGRIMTDLRSALPEGTSKRWGTGALDTY